MRYFAHIAYQGTTFHGWQKQIGQVSVQSELEEKLSLILRQDILITGCGRTDTGVHATNYFFHFDFQGTIPQNFVFRLNQLIHPHVSVYDVYPVHPDSHARFDAKRRAYEYRISWVKNPFLHKEITYLPMANTLNREQLEKAAALLLNYESFFPFCKTDSDVKTMACTLYHAYWEWRDDVNQMVFHISANRFLRGMVRLIVGMCLNVARGRISLHDVDKALTEQSRLTRSESAPAEGLYLTEVIYDWESILP